VIVDDHALVRAGLRAMLTLRGGFDVVGEAGDGAMALAVIEAQRPDLVLLDLSMPEMNGLDVLRRLRDLRPSPRVLIVSQYTDPQLAAQALAFGARGVIVKQAVESDLFRALDLIGQGREFVGAPIDTERVQRLRRETGFRAPAPLTDREQEVLRLIIDGASASNIADSLGISPHTAVRHRANLMRKLEVHNRVELMKRVQELALDR
jgi:DNA-binding NarL/FixJ family response regulator